MSQLTLATLGAIEVRHDGEALAFRTRKSLALLIYLAVEGGQHTRESLAAFFWPESDAEHGRALLRRNIAYLRQTLGEAGEPGGGAHLIVERDTLIFNPRSDFAIDLRLIETALRGNPAKSSLASDGDARQEAMDRLARAAGLYRGDFLADLLLGDTPDFDDWAARQREHWHDAGVAVLDRLSALQAEAGDNGAAKETINRWLALSPLDETASARLIRLHLAAGDRDAALRAYEACRARLAAELGVAPSPEVEALAARIRQTLPPRPLERPGPAISPAALPEAPLIGRGGEFVKLAELYHTAFRGGVQVALLEGEAGIGKTRLAGEFLGWAASREAYVLRGRALDTGGRIPYQPVVEALRRAVERENVLEDLLSDVWLAELARLLPELRERYPDLPEPHYEEAVARTRLFEAVTRLGLALAGRSPLVIFFDDVHWSDAASLDLLRYSLLRWAEQRARVLVLLALRPEALADAPALTDLLAGLGRDLPVTRLALGPLTQADTLRWLRELAAGGKEQAARGATRGEDDAGLAEFGGWLFEQTGGQPFYIAETLRALFERGVLSARRQAGEGWALAVAAPADQAELRRLIPPGVGAMLRARFAHLSPDAFALLCAGAVLGHDFSFEQPCAMAEIAEREALPALDELLRARLWREAGAGFVFAHDMIRHAAYDAAGEARRRFFHRRAVPALQGAGASAAQISYHAFAGGLYQVAFRAALQAGDEAMRVFAVRDAAAFYERAREAAGSPAGRTARGLDLGQEDLTHMLQGLGRAYEFLNEWGRAEAVYTELLEFGRPAMPAVEAIALNRLSTVAAQGYFDLPRAAGLLQEALGAAARSGDKTVLAESEWNLAQLNFYMWNLPLSVEHARRSMGLAEELGQRELYARSLNTIAYDEMMLGDDWPRAEQDAGRARELFAALGNRAMEADCLSIMTIVRANGGFYEAGIAAGREGIAIAREAENPWGQANCAWAVGRALLEQGEFDQALDVARAGVEAARAAGHPPSLLFNLNVVGSVYAAAFAPDAAIALHEQAWAIAERLRHPLLMEWAIEELCAAHALRGDWQEAARWALQALQVRDYRTVFAGSARWPETEALLRSGHHEAAAQDLRRFADQHRNIGYDRRYRLLLLRALAVLHEWQGEITTALEDLRQAAALAEEIGNRGELWRTWADLARLQQALGHEVVVQENIDRAAKLVSEIASRLRNKQLRGSFLATEQVRSLMQR